MPKVCYMMVGLPGSGKSTASEQLLKEIENLTALSTDEYIEKYAQEVGKTYNDVYREVGDKAQKWMNQQIKELIKSKEAFIWDQTNVYATARIKKINMLKQNGYEVTAIVVEISDEELNKRIKKRSAEGGKKIPYSVLGEMKKNYTRPEYSEGFKEIYIIGDNNIPMLISKVENKITLK